MIGQDSSDDRDTHVPQQYMWEWWSRAWCYCNVWSLHSNMTHSSTDTAHSHHYDTVISTRTNMVWQYDNMTLHNIRCTDSHLSSLFDVKRQMYGQRNRQTATEKVTLAWSPGVYHVTQAGRSTFSWVTLCTGTCDRVAGKTNIRYIVWLMSQRSQPRPMSLRVSADLLPCVNTPDPCTA